MIRTSLGGLAALLVAVFLTPPALAQEEFPPPQGMGRVVVVASGQLGADAYRPITQEIAKLGYDAVLFDGNKLEGTRGQALKDAIPKALAMPHALPGKVALVGFSLGGGIALFYGAGWSDQVATTIVWYPLTSEIPDVKAFMNRMTVPTLMFAGEADTYKNCCVIGRAREIAAAADGHPFQLVTYPNTQHDFIRPGRDFNGAAKDDAFARMTAMLKKYLGN